MSFASSLTSGLRAMPIDRGATSSGAGRDAIVGHVDRWFAAAGATSTERAALVVLDVDLDGALPPDEEVRGMFLASGIDDGPPERDDADDGARRRRLARCVERALSSLIRPGDAVARVDAGRFAILRTLDDGAAVVHEARTLAGRVEEALVGCPEAFGARVTAGGTTLRTPPPRSGRETLGMVTAAMLEGKLLTDDRVVVAIAPGG